MPKTKYFDTIRTAQKQETHSTEGAGLAPFRLDDLAPSGWLARARSRLASALLPRIYAVSRRYRPVLTFGGLTHVTRDAQVREVLLRPGDFITPFGPEMAELGQGATFLLGLEGPEHDRLHAILLKVIRREDARWIGTMSAAFGTALLDNAPGRIDAIADLIKRVPAEICLRYFGLECEDVDQFGDWTIALSVFLFGDPFGDPKARELALNARARIDAVISDALVRAQQRHQAGTLTAASAETLVERLVLLQHSDRITDLEIKAILMGLATGFIPTNTLAASNMLQELLRRPDALALATRAARDDDHQTMRRIIMEAGRLNPALSPGQWRYCPRDTVLDLDGYPYPVKAGTTLLVSTQSALRDPRVWSDPGAFRIDRTNPDGSLQEPDLVFGIGPHWCLGKHLAIEQIAALFTALLKRPGLRRAPGNAGRLVQTGPFPRHQTLQYATPTSQQSMLIVLVPLPDRSSRDAVETALATLGNPAFEPIRTALDSTGIVHFCSLAVIDCDEQQFLSFEISADGDAAQALQRIAACAEPLLRPAFAPLGLAPDQDLAAFMGRHIVTLHGKPWGATGLNYNGLPEFPVQKVKRQEQFADFAGRVLRDFVASETVRGSHPMLAIAHLRRILRGNAEIRSQATPAQRALIDEAKSEGWDAFHLQTQANRLRLAHFRPVSDGQAFARFLRSRDRRMITFPLTALALLGAWLLRPAGGAGLFDWALLALFKAPLFALVCACTLVATYLVLLRRAERREVPEQGQAPLAKLRALLAQENPPGYAQNHILAVGTLKRGWLRRLTHAFALWANRVVVESAFRPGFVMNMGTIHYARWWAIPGTRKAAFYANFDGSWESYLEDFITRVSKGQSAAWSNWEGFPRTRLLINEGARDGDSFKRWVRIQQQLVPFWYSRFPGLTAEQIRTNALIHSGLDLTRCAEEAEEWLRCFGSMPRTANAIEADEVQALVFRGMGRLRHSACLAIGLPANDEALGEWLCWLRGKAMLGGGGLDHAACQTLEAEGVIARVPRPAGQPEEFSLCSGLTLTFGDRPLSGEAEGDEARALHHPSRQAVFLGLGPAGLACFPVPNCPGSVLVDAMPAAFQMGMAARSRITGDTGASAPERWRWHDDPQREQATQGVLLLYAATREELEWMASVHSALLANHGGTVLARTDCAPAWADPERENFEHFGYRDGIAQPSIRGMTRSAANVPERDLIEPGEFILGYANAQGYPPPSPCLPVEADVRGTLPYRGFAPSRFPDFGEPTSDPLPRDFGRNGTFLVLRELKQDVEGFEGFIDRAVHDLSQGGFRDLSKLVGQDPDRDWIKAKLMGRWPNGRPLVGNPVNRPSGPGSLAAETANDFSYGADDPQGLACPFGAHIRRTNPRDSKQPGDQAEQVITNRHRLIRRGRTYRKPQTGEKGLLFACICADLERQFEFVQQFWANAPAFHGLKQEPDPIAGSGLVDPIDGHALERRFTIPTQAGPIQIDGLKSFVQTMAGGYFFLPSRSALTWLGDAALGSARARKGANHD